MTKITQTALDNLLEKYYNPKHRWYEPKNFWRNSEFRLDELLKKQGYDLDISGLNLSSKELTNINFVGINIKNCNFNNSILRYSNFRNNDLTGCDFSHSDIANADFLYSNYLSAGIKYTNIEGTDKAKGFKLSELIDIKLAKDKEKNQKKLTEFFVPAPAPAPVKRARQQSNEQSDKRQKVEEKTLPHRRSRSPSP